MKNQSKTNWDRVNKLTDETIDYSDSPEVTEEFFKIMTIREPNKKSIHIRLDSEVINFFKSHSKRYQTKINEVLKAYKLAVERQELKIHH
jgi:uncharacterized protein (DUF4415 family)